MNDKRNFFSGFITGVASCIFVYVYLQSDQGKEMIAEAKNKIQDAGRKLYATIDELDEEAQFLLEKSLEVSKQFRKNE